MAFKIAVTQFVPKKADLKHNLDRIAEAIRVAHGQGAELVCFAETATTGYFLEGGVLECAMTREDLLEEVQSRLTELDRTVDVLIGFYEKFGGNLYNSASYLQVGQDAKHIHTYRKFFLPTYGVFDEERFVGRGHDLGVFETRLGKFAILICEDVWHSILSTLCAVAGAQVILVPSASPARGFSGETIGNHDRYKRMLRSVSDEHGVFCVNAQLIGFEGGKGFIGGSVVVDPFGRVIGEAPLGEESVLLADVDLELTDLARSQLPLTSDLQSAWGDLKKIVNEIDF